MLLISVHSVLGYLRFENGDDVRRTFSLQLVNFRFFVCCLFNCLFGFSCNTARTDSRFYELIQMIHEKRFDSKERLVLESDIANLQLQYKWCQCVSVMSRFKVRFQFMSLVHNTTHRVKQMTVMFHSQTFRFKLNVMKFTLRFKVDLFQYHKPYEVQMKKRQNPSL